MENILVTKNLCKSYGKQKALDNLNLNVPNGSIYGFVGKNGAGKTTLIRLVCGLQYQDSGEVIINGVKNTDPKINSVRKKFGAIVETPALHLNMTAKENVRLQLDILGLKDEKKIDDLLEFVGLSNTGKKLAANFSLGMRQRLAIAIALCGDPEFLVLDEPVNGLDPQGIIDMRELLHKINQERKITILISSHILDELARVATHYGFIANGKIIAEISAEELEKSGQRHVTLFVNKTNGVEQAMSVFENEFEVVDNYTIVVHGSIIITELILALHKYGIVVDRLVDKEESLEERFFELLGGAQNV
jgi:ABC-2 type transport system ATP-binding protein